VDVHHRRGPGAQHLDQAELAAQLLLLRRQGGPHRKGSVLDKVGAGRKLTTTGHINKGRHGVHTYVPVQVDKAGADEPLRLVDDLISLPAEPGPTYGILSP
jgi:hypothetical protein